VNTKIVWSNDKSSQVMTMQESKQEWSKNKTHKNKKYCHFLKIISVVHSRNMKSLFYLPCLSTLPGKPWLYLIDRKYGCYVATIQALHSTTCLGWKESDLKFEEWTRWQWQRKWILVSPQYLMYKMHSNTALPITWAM
jgi:hypothetical protein